MRQTDRRIWLVCSTNQFEGCELSFSKGHRDGKSLQATARCYLAERIGGSPADMGWESQSVMLVPSSKLNTLNLNGPDLAVIRDMGT